MALEERPLKLFTVEEANRLLPEVKTILGRLKSHQEAVRKLEEAQAVEELSWLKEDGTVSAQAQGEIRRIAGEIEQKGKQLEDELAALEALGVQLKGLQEGLIDFFSSRAGQLVFLCWKEGEDRVRFWHDLESGFAGRQPIEGPR
ncbi:MAG: DUF2203 domain-containing protein [Candidatus Omnitrophica bacterium]|nr:DUF2203 domain-containing protein [Candidatus Omnitrophota bacterium]